MLQIREFTRPDTLDAAYGLLTASKANAVVGGGAYLRMGSKRIGTAIDLSRLALNDITADAESFRIGASVTFGELERSEPLQRTYSNLFSEALKDVVGVQFRNSVTVGATVFSRYGFSDLLTPLLALDATVTLHHHGTLALSDYLTLDKPLRDILTYVTVPTDCSAAVYRSQRLSTGDYAALNVAVAKTGGSWRIAVGARPQRATLAQGAMAVLNSGPWSPTLVDAACEAVAAELTYGTNVRGTAAYRRLLASALLKSAIMEVQSNADQADR